MERNFYPRSPCGERPLFAVLFLRGSYISIHALLAESDMLLRDSTGRSVISIHALLAESDCQWRRSVKLFRQFLSTLSLRRATTVQNAKVDKLNDFYPRSPCGERRVTVLGIQHRVGISIHALLAESDATTGGLFFVGRRFLSTLSLRRATYLATWQSDYLCYFYPRSPCGERLNFPAR